MAIRADSSNYRNRNNQDPRDFVSRPGRGGEDDDRGRDIVYVILTQGIV